MFVLFMSLMPILLLTYKGKSKESSPITNVQISPIKFMESILNKERWKRSYQPSDVLSETDRPISLLSVISKTLEKSLLPYITANIPNTPMQHGYQTQHSTVTALHTLNNTIAKGFNQMAPPARTITVTLDMSKAFDTIYIHTLIRKLLQTNIPGTIIKFIANYIKGRKAYTTY